MFAAIAHYHHLTDDIIQGGKLKYENGTLAVPSAPDRVLSWIATRSKSIGSYSCVLARTLTIRIQ